MLLLNLDGGEYSTEPEELYALADIVHIACGGHAGDAASMDRVARACAKHGTRVGAHPSYVDREGFGRRALDVAPEILLEQIAAQCMDLQTVITNITRAAIPHASNDSPQATTNASLKSSPEYPAVRPGGGAAVTVSEPHALPQIAHADAPARVLGGDVAVSVSSVKPHGALYHAAHKDLRIARACVDASVRVFGREVAIVGLAGGSLEEAAREAGLKFLREEFADRGVRDDGSLIPRGEPGALIEDPDVASARARKIASAGTCDTLCIHADTPSSLAIARAVRAALHATKSPKST